MKTIFTALAFVLSTAAFPGDESRCTFSNLPTNAADAWVGGRQVQFGLKWNRRPKESDDYIVTIDSHFHRKRRLQNVVVSQPDANGIYTMTATVPGDTPTAPDWTLKLESDHLHLDICEVDNIPIFASYDPNAPPAPAPPAPAPAPTPTPAPTPAPVPQPPAVQPSNQTQPGQPQPPTPTQPGQQYSQVPCGLIPGNCIQMPGQPPVPAPSQNGTYGPGPNPYAPPVQNGSYGPGPNPYLQPSQNQTTGNYGAPNQQPHTLTVNLPPSATPINPYVPPNNPNPIPAQYGQAPQPQPAVAGPNLAYGTPSGSQPSSQPAPQDFSQQQPSAPQPQPAVAGPNLSYGTPSGTQPSGQPAPQDFSQQQPQNGSVPQPQPAVVSPTGQQPVQICKPRN